MRYKGLTRVLALDLHPRRFGYVVIESPDRLLDWGVRSHRNKGGATDALIGRLRALLELWGPSVLVLQNPSRMLSLGRDRLLKQIAAEAKDHQIAVRILKKGLGADQGERLIKYENARRAAEHFSAIRWNLPPKRKAWESEDYRMSMFAAATLAMAQLHIA